MKNKDEKVRKVIEELKPIKELKKEKKCGIIVNEILEFVII